MAEIICLANSRKMQGRCVAGLRTDSRGWVRPVSQRDYGELLPQHYRCGRHGDARVLDVVEIPLLEHRPLPCQPENWLIDDTVPWRLVRRPPSEGDFRLLGTNIEHDPLLFGCTGDKIAEPAADAAPRDASLAIVAPSEATLKWSSFDHKRKTRMRFILSGTMYDLRVTDPILENQWRPPECGSPEYMIHPDTACHREDQLLLTISLADPWKGYCYKLVAAAFWVPRWLVE